MRVQHMQAALSSWWHHVVARFALLCPNLCCTLPLAPLPLLPTGLAPHSPSPPLPQPTSTLNYYYCCVYVIVCLSGVCAVHVSDQGASSGPAEGVEAAAD